MVQSTTKVIVFFSNGIFVLILLIVIQVARAQIDDVCACSFQDTDPPDCRVYGQLGAEDGALIPWYRASQDCLDAFNITDQSISPFALGSILPNGHGSAPDVDALVSFLRFDERDVTNDIKPRFLGDFFEEDEAGNAKFKNTITANGETLNCEENVGSCWDAVNQFLSANQQVLIDIGETLSGQASLSKEKDQSQVRIMLCEDGTATECSPLSEQVQEYMQGMPGSTDCSQFGFTPDNSDSLPYCGASSPGGNTGTNTGDNNTATDNNDEPAETKSSGIHLLPVARQMLYMCIVWWCYL